MMMDESYFEQQWDFLKKGIRHIQHKKDSQLSFEGLYCRAYNMVVHNHGDKLYVAVRDAIVEHLQETVLEQIKNCGVERFLETLHIAWMEHKTAMDMIKTIVMYMERVYVPHSSVKPVHNLGVELFREEIICDESVKEQLVQNLCQLVADQCNGTTINQASVKNAREMLMELNAYEEEQIEGPFLERSAEFFRAESLRFLAENDVTFYVNKVEELIGREPQGVDILFRELTASRIISVMNKELISKHMTELVEMENSGVMHMLENNYIQDLKGLCKLLDRVSDGLSPVVKCMVVFFGSKYDQLVNAIGTAADPESFVQALQNLKDHLDQFLLTVLGGDQLLEQIIQRVFAHFLNSNPKCPEYLSLYIDDKLRNSLKAPLKHESETFLDKAVQLFRFLQEKDVFGRYYKQHLARRLLQSRNLSNEEETSMISKLQLECGCYFTSKLHGMFRDMQISATLMEGFKEFRDRLDIPNPVDIQVRMLTTGYWPTQAVLPRIVLPPETHLAFENYKAFYLNKHSGRKITLNPCLGGADINAVFYGPPKMGPGTNGPDEQLSKNSTTRCKETVGRTYTFQVSTYQMCVLMLFNVKSSFSFPELLVETEIPERELKRCLWSLSMGKPQQKVLCRSGNAKDIGREDSFWVNENYYSLCVRVKIQTASSRGETDPERKETRAKVEENRKHEVEAAIVRTMKMRKRMAHSCLIAQVTSELKHRFMPSPELIKKGIESLIDREYLQPTDDSQGPMSYDYVA